MRSKWKIHVKLAWGAGLTVGSPQMLRPVTLSYQFLVTLLPELAVVFQKVCRFLCCPPNPIKRKASQKSPLIFLLIADVCPGTMVGACDTSVKNQTWSPPLKPLYLSLRDSVIQESYR